MVLALTALAWRGAVVAVVAMLMLILAANVVLPQPATRPGVEPADAWTCPATHAIKGNFTPTDPREVCIYHVQGGQYYVKTKPDVVAPIQASAERGWVLWVKETKTERAENALRTTVSWGPMTASSSEDACESRLKDQMWKLSGVSETKPPEGEKMYYKLSNGQTLTFLWFRQHRSPDDLPLRTQELSHSCLPDTVDPRGPKVK